jgi:peptide/nickel transport system ATP-binding protein
VDARVSELLRLVGLDPADGTKYPHEFSGGQRQRVAVARALASLGPTYLFITHNFAVLQLMAHRIGVMYLGRLVELAPVRRPAPPIYRILLAAVPDNDVVRPAGKPISGDMPNPIDPPAGRSFHPRCPMPTSAAGKIGPACGPPTTVLSHATPFLTGASDGGVIAACQNTATGTWDSPPFAVVERALPW